MKKSYLIMAAIASIALASCSDEQFVGDIDQGAGHGLKEISFVSNTGKTTRGENEFTGSAAAAKLNNKFIVGGFKGDGTSNPATGLVFDNYQVKWANNTAHTTTSNTNDWEYVGLDFLAPSGRYDASDQTGAKQSIKYWDYSASQYDFIAYSTSDADVVTDNAATGKVHVTAITPSTAGNSTNGAYKLTGAAADLQKCYIADLVTVYRNSTDENPQGNYNKVVTFTFRPLTAKVRIALYETIPGYSVKNVVFYTADNTKAETGDDAGKAFLYSTGNAFNTNGTCTVYFPTIGSDNQTDKDYNKAHVAFSPTTNTNNEVTGAATNMSFGALSGDLTNQTFAGSEFKEAAITGNDKGYLGRSSNAATYAGVYQETSGSETKTLNYYTIVLPNEDGAELILKVDYTLVSTDGSGEEITVTGATAKVPAKFAAWKSGYAYTYLFKISQNTNGATNPSAGLAGLYPITFDAVVVNDEVDNTQETITTVSEPSISTYAKGTMVTANNEYLTDANIYVFVEDGNTPPAALTVGTNANLYTVTLTAGSNAGATAAQTINEASVANAIAKGGSVTDANGWIMTVTSASGLTAVSSIAEDDSPTGVAITINGAKFTPTSDGIYVFEYIKGSDKYYKIIKVVAAQQSGGNQSGGQGNG